MIDESSEKIDLGLGYVLEWTCWSPDRELNPQYEGIPDIEKFGAVITHTKPDGEECFHGIIFECPEARRVCRDRQAMWDVECWDPLTVSPSLLCLTCGDHGFIREGKWVPA